MSERKLIRVSEESFKFISAHAERKSTETKKVDLGEAADMLIATAIGRKKAIDKWAKANAKPKVPRKPRAKKEKKPRAKKAKPAAAENAS